MSRIWSFFSSMISLLSCNWTTYVSVFSLIGTSKTLAGSKFLGWDKHCCVLFMQGRSMNALWS